MCAAAAGEARASDRRPHRSGSGRRGSGPLVLRRPLALRAASVSLGGHGRRVRHPRSKAAHAERRRQEGVRLARGAVRERLADAEQMLTYPFLEQLLFSGPQVARISPDLPRHPPISPISHDLPRSLMISHDLALLWPAQACASISAHVLEWSRLPSFVDINLRLLAAPLVRRPRTALRYDLPPPPIFTTLH